MRAAVSAHPPETPPAAGAAEQRTAELLRRITRQVKLQGAALENTSNAVIVTDPQGAILWANPAFCRISGYALGEVIGRTPRLLKSGQHDRAFYRELWNSVLEGRTWKGMLTNRRKDGTLYFGEQTITPVVGDDGTITHFVAIMNDVTERKLAQEELRATHAQLSHLLEHSPAVTYGQRRVNAHLVLHAVSSNVATLLGYAAPELTTPDWWVERIHPDDRKVAQASIVETETRGRSRTEYRLRHADGSYRWIEDTRRLVPGNAPARAEFVGLWHDITERKRAEAVMATASDDAGKRSRAAWELGLVVGATVLVAALLFFTDVLQGPVDAFLHSSHLVDEMLGAALVGVIGIGAFAFRRWREAHDQVAQERSLRQALRTLHGELETRVQQRTAELARANEVLRAEAEQRNRVESALSQERLLMRTMIDQVPDLIYVKDRDSRFLLANEALARLMGVAQPSDLLGRTDAEFHPAEQAAQFRADEARVLAGESILEQEEVATDGSGRVFLTTKLPRRGPDGTITGVIGIGREITERKFVERALRLFRAQVDQSSETFEVIDPETARFLDVNAKGPAELGLTREEYLQQHVWDLDPTIKPEAWPEILRRLRTQGSFSGEGRHVRKDGTSFPVEFSARWVRLDRDYIVTIVRDITGRQQTEQALRDSEALYHSLVEQMPVGVFRKDIAGRYVYANEWFVRLTGADVSTYLGRRPTEVAELLRGRESGTYAVHDAAILTEGEDHHAQIVGGALRRIERESCWIQSNGEVAHFRVVKTPVFDSTGQIAGSQGVLVDITAQKRTEAGLRETDLRFRQLAENVHEVFWLTNLDKTEILYISPGYERVWGRSCESLRTSPATWAEAIHPEDRERVRASWPKQVLGTYDEEYRVVRPDGSERWIRDRAFPVKDEAGRVYRVAGLAEDVTEWKRAAEDLRRARDQYHSIFEKSVEGIYQSTPEGTFLAGNPALARILGYESVAELIAERRDIGEQGYVIPGRREEFKRLIEANGTVAEFEYEAYRKDRSRVWISENAHVIRDRSGRPICYEGTVHDITDRKRAELRLRLQHAVTAVLAEAGAVPQINRAILATIGGGLGWDFGEIWRVDRASDTLRCVDVHPPGAPEFDALEKQTRGMWVARGQGLVGAVWAEGRAGWSEAAGIDQRCLRSAVVKAAGMNGWIGFPIRLRNEVVGVISFFSRRVSQPDDALLTLLTTLGTQFGQFLEREQLTEQFRQAQKLEAIGTLAGGIAHDFNNIIAGISGYSELALMQVDDRALIQECLTAVTQGTQRAAGLVRQILAFSRQQEQQRQPIQLRHIVREATNLLRATIPATIEFQLSFARDLPTVLADATQVHQVVMNLGTNAWHAMRDRPGRLGFCLERVPVEARLAEQHAGLRIADYVRLSVSDTGHGMDAATLSRIFEPFFTTKAPGEGTGLGLSVVHGIMQSHEGVVTVTSQPGQGTCFQLYFPVCATEKSETGDTHAPLPRGQGERLLFVDDEEALAKMGEGILARLGYHVDACSTPQDALARVQRDPARYDLVVTDLTMPGLTGVELAGAMMAVRPDLPVLLVTGHNGNLTAGQVKALGIRELLLKPLSLHALALAVRRVLGESKKS